jgi:hypothetical protein
MDQSATKRGSSMLSRLVLAAFLLGHAVIHAGYLSPRPARPTGPTWPFDLTQSWLLTPLGAPGDALRITGCALLAVILGAFTLAAMSALGLLPATIWEWSTVIGATASLVMLAVFFHPWLAVGVAIDIVALWAVLVLGWTTTEAPGP